MVTDIDQRFLTGLPDNVEVRHHDISHDDLEPATYCVAHCRVLLQHLPDALGSLQRMVAALRPGGWLVAEEWDLGLFGLSGHVDAKAAEDVFHASWEGFAASGIMDLYCGRKLPGWAGQLRLDERGVDAVVAFAAPGESYFENFRLGTTNVRPLALAQGVSEHDFDRMLAVINSDAVRMVGGTLFAIWGRKPR